MRPPEMLSGLTLERIEMLVEEWGQPKYRTRQILRWIFEKRVELAEEMTDLPAVLRGKIAEVFPGSGPTVVRVQGSEDTTRKYLLKLQDGRYVETVLIPASPALYGSSSDRRTLCVSSQVGCAYACKFCASGLLGLTRNLTAGEIVAQLLVVEKHSGEKVNNIVFMGMGEPLANLKELLLALRILNEPWGVGIGARQMTVSTSGLAPMIRRMADDAPPVRLAISLHGATDEVRTKIMPVNARYPISDLVESLRYWQSKRKQIVTLEYILIKGVNDEESHARDLAKLTRNLKAKINLIPYNRVEGLLWERPEEERQERFAAILDRAGVPATLRREKGHDINAACGQLRLQAEETVS